MTVGELRELLEGVDDSCEMRIASQPSYPFEYSLERLEVVEADIEFPTPEGRPVVYLVEGSQLGYLAGVAAQAIGWR